jgi:lipopolysaccharide export system permease protein
MGFPSILDRYIFKEIFAAFAASFLIFLMTGLIAGFLPLLQKVMESGSGLAVVLFRMLINALPGILVTVMPLSLTIGTLMGLGRMAADNEIAAIKSSGVSISRLAPPVMIIAFLTFCLSLWCTLDLIPRAITTGHDLASKAASSGAGAAIKERAFFDKLEGLILYVGKMDPESGEMGQVFLRESTNPEEKTTIVAKTGRVTPDPQGADLILELRDGVILREGSHGSLTGSVAFKSYLFRYMAHREQGDNRRKSMEEKSIGQIREMIASMDPDKPGLDPQMRSYYQRVNTLGRVFITQRFTYPLACLALALVAFPLGLLNLGQSRMNNVSAGLVAIFVYYALTLVSERAARSGLGPPELVLPLPGLLYIAFGLYFIRCVRLERTPWIIRGPTNLALRLRGFRR